MDPTADQLIRDSFSNKKDAIAFFSQTLPVNIVEALDMPSLQVLPTSRQQITTMSALSLL